MFRTVEPKREKLETARSELAEVQEQLAAKQASLKEVEDKIKELQVYHMVQSITKFAIKVQLKTSKNCIENCISVSSSNAHPGSFVNHCHM